MNKYGKLLQLLRSRYNLSQSELEDKAGLARGALSDIENEHREPRINELESCAALFKVRLSDLIRASEELASGDVIFPSLVAKVSLKLNGGGGPPKNKKRAER